MAREAARFNRVDLIGFLLTLQPGKLRLQADNDFVGELCHGGALNHKAPQAVKRAERVDVSSSPWIQPRARAAMLRVSHRR